MDNQQQLLPIGSVIGHYRVVRHIASGGFGNTYEVEHVKLLRRHCVKEFFMRGINQRVGDTVTVSVEENRATFEQMRTKFMKEAQRMAQFRNPHVVPVTDFFEQNGTVYYVMDLIEGESLSSAMKAQGRPFTEAEVRAMLPQILDALSGIHEKGIYHLDLKPANIMRDADGHLWFIDFGASKQLSTNESQTLSTSTGLCYTPGYAPSELVQGAAKYIGPWTDFYSLGATLYNLLTQQKPPEIADIEEEGENAFTFPADVSGDMRRFVVWLMNVRRSERPQIVEEIEQQLTVSAAQPVVSNYTIDTKVASPKTQMDGEQTLKCSEDTEAVKRDEGLATVKSEEGLATVKRDEVTATVKHQDNKTKREIAESTVNNSVGTSMKKREPVPKRSKWKQYLLVAILTLILLILLQIFTKATNAKDETITFCPDSNHPHMIDLGLPSGTLWACCNVGADTPIAYGGYYAWGEKMEKTIYDTSSYLHTNGAIWESQDLGKSISGSRYDVATAIWGSAWAMPTESQMRELIDDSSHEWTTIDGTSGVLFTGSNGNRIFLPAAGYCRDGGVDFTGEFGRYWTATQGTSGEASSLSFDSSGRVYWYFYHRYQGFTVRPCKMMPAAALPAVPVSTQEISAADDNDMAEAIERISKEGIIITSYEGKIYYLKDDMPESGYESSGSNCGNIYVYDVDDESVSKIRIHIPSDESYEITGWKCTDQKITIVVYDRGRNGFGIGNFCTEVSQYNIKTGAWKDIARECADAEFIDNGKEIKIKWATISNYDEVDFAYEYEYEYSYEFIEL